jgi:hypothetical protein
MKNNKKKVSYRKVDDIVNYFNSYKRDKIWKLKKVELQEAFKFQLLLLETYLLHGASEKLMQSFMYRLALGYYGIQSQSGISSGIVSLATIGLPAKETTGDHVFGAVEIGKTIRDAYEVNNRNIDFMVNEWLYDNLYLWLTIKVSRVEHNSKNIIKNRNSIQEKRKMLHYKSVSELVAKQH